MKQITLLILLFFVVGCGAKSIPLEKFTSTEHHFSISHPPEWTLVESPQEEFYSLGITSDIDGVTLRDDSISLAFVYGEIWDRDKYTDNDDPELIQLAWLSNYGLELKPIDELIIVDHPTGQQVKQLFSGTDLNTGDTFTVSATTLIDGDQLCVFVGIMTLAGVDTFTPIIDVMFESIELGK